MIAAPLVTGEVLIAGGHVESLAAELARGGGEGLRDRLALGLPRSSLKPRNRVCAGEAVPAQA